MRVVLRAEGGGERKEWRGQGMKGERKLTGSGRPGMEVCDSVCMHGRLCVFVYVNVS